MHTHWNRWIRKIHRLGAVFAAIPLLVIISAGILLQVKKQVVWVQPEVVQGSSKTPQLALPAVLEIAKTISQAQVHGWEDIDRVDMRPKDGILKVISKNRWELQIDFATGAVQSSTYRRSDLIESLHDGSWFGTTAKFAVFLPAGLLLFALCLTGIYLWILPHWVRRKKATHSNP